MNWRTYHNYTKHTVEKLMTSRHALDWANMPDPFRHYEGAPVVDLPGGAAPPAARAIDVLAGGRGPAVSASGADYLSSLLFHAAAVSAAKTSPGGTRYALRVNPSSGNLHPTEFHFAARGMPGWADGLYHYRPSEHTAERRATGGFVARILEQTLAPWFRDAKLVFVLTTIAWREAWKYQSRAYRYCCHDIGHAWEALALAARALGGDASAFGYFTDERLARTLGSAADEWPMLIVVVTPPPLRGEPEAASEPSWSGGDPNTLSAEVVAYPAIEAIHKSCLTEPPLRLFPQPAARPAPAGRRIRSTEAGFGRIVRLRRSALDFRGGEEVISALDLNTLLGCAVRAHQADFEGDLTAMAPARFIELYLYVHRVQDLEPGLYRFGAKGLELLRAGDQRVSAAGLSLGQPLAGNSCLTFSMVADLARAAEAYGDRGYRYAHFEAGAIGQRLYIASEALGFRSTGIGAFYDDAVHRYLDLDLDGGNQVIYHFACGHAVEDPRL